MTVSIRGKVNDVYPAAVATLVKTGTRVSSRNGDTLEIRPVVMDITNPAERVVTSYGHPINPAFAVAEAIWILSGSRDVRPLKYFNSKIDTYSDDGDHFNAAYGWRLRAEHGYDQLEDAIATLRNDPQSRQAVLNIWAPSKDRGFQPELVEGSTDEFKLVPRITKDRACNLMSELLIRRGRLEWTQIMRSNDVVWGTPNNFMQWMHVMEYVATHLGVPMGKYVHFTNSLHIYDYHQNEANQIGVFDLYKELGQDGHYPMGAEGVTQQAILSMMATIDALSNETSINPKVIRDPDFMDLLDAGASPYWREVLKLFSAWMHYKKGEDEQAFDVLQSMEDQVLAVAQMRHFYYWRWYKDQAVFGKPLHSNVNVDQWLKESHHVASNNAR